MRKHYILMADIIKSSKRSGGRLMNDFRKIVEAANHKNKKLLLSPLTITLGDEFQGVCTSLADALKIVQELEEAIIRNEIKFKLRYVLNYGKIDTPINKKIAYQMTGQGLSDARNMLVALKKNKINRFQVALTNKKKTDLLNACLLIYQSIVDDWKLKDYQLVSDLLETRDYKTTAENLDKDLSLVWRRKKSLKISEYEATKFILSELCLLN